MLDIRNPRLHGPGYEALRRQPAAISLRPVNDEPDNTSYALTQSSDRAPLHCYVAGFETLRRQPVQIDHSPYMGPRAFDDGADDDTTSYALPLTSQPRVPKHCYLPSTPSSADGWRILVNTLGAPTA